MPVERSAGAVVYRLERGRPLYLLLHYEAGHWDLPKGNIERGESREMTAKREIEEETGIRKVEFDPGFETWIRYFFRREGKTVFKIVDFLLARTREKKVKISFEHIGYEWLPFESALERLTYKTAKDVLVKANEHIAKRRRLEEIAKKIRRFKGLAIAKSARNAVPGEGNPNAKIVFVGQAPGREEDRTGRPFQGMAGRFLDRMLGMAGLRRNDVFITSVVKWFPPGNRRPTKKEIGAGLPFLIAQLEVIRPELIVLLGDVACESMIGKVDLLKMHGKVVRRDGRNYFVTFHPAAGMRFPKIRRMMVRDFSKLRRIAGH